MNAEELKNTLKQGVLEGASQEYKNRVQALALHLTADSGLSMDTNGYSVKRCEWCNFSLIEGQENPQLCGACYRRWLVDIPQGASNEEVEKEEKKWEIGN